MLYWILYTLSVITLSIIVVNLSKKLKKTLFSFLLVIFLTPARIQAGSHELGPAIFIFIYDLVLENKLSTLSLRPLALSLFFLIFFGVILFIFRKKFY